MPVMRHWLLTLLIFLLLTGTGPAHAAFQIRAAMRWPTRKPKPAA